MFCTNCGTQLPDGTRFCTNCGAPAGSADPIVEEAPAQESAQDAAQPEGQASEPSAQADCSQQGSYQQSSYQPPQQPVYSTASGPLKSMAPYLTWAIIVTALCCWPLGIPAIINASRINKCNDAGDYAGAEEAANKSKKWTIAAAILGFILCGGLSAFALLFFQT